MADPVTPDYFRAMMIFKHPSGLPRDIFVNSFVVRNDGPNPSGEAFAEDVRQAIVSFYSEPVATGSSIATFMPSNILPNPELRIYDLGQAPPRDPTIVAIDASTWGGGTPANALPYEVSACISWRTAVNRAWGRGRTFLGPLVASAKADVAGVPRLSPAFIDTLVQAGTRFLSGAVVRPAVLGKLGPNLINGGWVDNEFDTQRRRGTEASARTEFVGP